MKKLYSNNNGFGAEELVKKKLWSFGHSVKHLRNGSYDLLVDSKIAVEVKSSKYYLDKNNDFYWTLGALYDRDPWDVLAAVLYLPTGKPRIAFLTRKEVLGKYGRAQVNKDGRTITVFPAILIKSKKDRELDFGETNIAKIFSNLKN